MDYRTDGSLQLCPLRYPQRRAGAPHLQAIESTREVAVKWRGPRFAGSHGWMRTVLNSIAGKLRQRVLADYMGHVYYKHINVLSKANTARYRSHSKRFGPILKRFRHEDGREHLRLQHARNPRLPPPIPRTCQPDRKKLLDVP